MFLFLRVNPSKREITEIIKTLLLRRRKRKILGDKSLSKLKKKSKELIQRVT